MGKPQQPELRRSGDNAVVPGEPPPGPETPRRGEGPEGLVPDDNLPGHHPDDEQDKPDLDDFVARAKAVAARAEDDQGGDPEDDAQDGSSDDGRHDDRHAGRDTREGGGQDDAADVLAGPGGAPAHRPRPGLAQEQARGSDIPAPVLALAALQWRVATFPVRVAGALVRRVRGGH